MERTGYFGDSLLKLLTSKMDTRVTPAHDGLGMSVPEVVFLAITGKCEKFNFVNFVIFVVQLFPEP